MFKQLGSLLRRRARAKSGVITSCEFTKTNKQTHKIKMKSLHFLLAIFAVLASSLIVDAASKSRIAFIDMPTKFTSIVWKAGDEVRLPFCWQGLWKQPYNMESHEWKFKLKRVLMSSVELEPTFEPFGEHMSKNSPTNQKWGSQRWKYLASKSVARTPRCWVATFTLPEDLGSSGAYYIELTRVRDFMWDSSYKSPKFRIERPYEYRPALDTADSVDPSYHGFKPTVSVSDEQMGAMKQSAKDLWKKAKFWEKPKQDTAEVDMKPLENAAFDTKDDQVFKYDNGGASTSQPKKSVSFSNFEPGVDTPFDQAPTRKQ